MREFIGIIEESNRTLPPKPLSQVTDADVIKAYIEIDDLRNVLIGQWDQIDFGEDNGEPIYHPLPRSFSDLTTDQLSVVIRDYQERIQDARANLTEISTLSIIPISRRLKNLPDIKNPVGVHWSYGAAANPWLANHGEHILYAQVNNNDVDWTTTLARAVFWWQEEQEITPASGTKINLLKIEFAPNTNILV